MYLVTILTVTVFVETKIVTKSRLHCTYLTSIPTFSAYFVGSGSEDKKGCVWDRHYQCIVAKLPHTGDFFQ